MLVLARDDPNALHAAAQAVERDLRTLPGLGVLGERPGELRGIHPGEGAAALEQLGV